MVKKVLMAFLMLFVFVVGIMPEVIAVGNGKGFGNSGVDNKNDLRLNMQNIKNEFGDGSGKGQMGNKIGVLANAFERRNANENEMKAARERFESMKGEFAKIEARHLNKKNNFMKSKQEFGKCKAEKMDKSMCEQIDAQTLEAAKEYVKASAERTMNYLLQVKAKIESNQDLSEADFDDAISNIDSAIQELKNIIAEVENTTTKEELKEAARSANKIWEKMHQRLRFYGAEMMFGKVGSVIERTDALNTRLDKIVAWMEEKDISSDEIQEKIDSFNLLIANANEKNTDAYEIMHYLREKSLGEHNLTDMEKDQLKEDIQEAKDLMKSAYEDLKSANKVLIEIIQQARSKGGNISDLLEELTEGE